MIVKKEIIYMIDPARSFLMAKKISNYYLGELKHSIIKNQNNYFRHTLTSY